MTERDCSYSKLNLFLKVTARRPDRYHELETLFLPLARPADSVTFEFDAPPGIRVSSSLPGLPENLENLAGRAALAYADAAGVRPSWSIFIEKVIPVAAGMGGGSSNAATVLRMLNRRYGNLSKRELAALAVTLGADVPFFLEPHVAIATGVGEELRRVGGVGVLPPLLAVNPRFPVSAKWAYQHLDPGRIGPAAPGRLAGLVAGLRNGDAKQVAEHLLNDLAPALYGKFPLLTKLREFMIANGALNAEITGSGPTLYAVTGTVEARHRLAEALRTNFSPETVTVFDDIPCESVSF